MAMFLIRHGETASNAARIVQTPDTPLSLRGIAQAERLARRVAREGAALIVSSDYTRALMTADRLHTATGAAIVTEAGLQERNFGDLRGRPYAELGFDMFAEGYAPPGGESWEQFHARVDTVWQRLEEIARQIDANLAVVTHGLVCYSLALRHLCLPAGITAPQRWENTSVTIVEPAPPWSVQLLNCTAHLDGDASADRTSLSGS